MIRCSIMLILIDIVGKPVLLRVELRLVRGGQVAVRPRCAFAVFPGVEVRFFALEVCGFARSQRAVLNAISDAILLIFLALADRRIGGAGRGLSACRNVNASQRPPAPELGFLDCIS